MKLVPSLDVAEQFLSYFDGRITFQTFDDKEGNKRLTKILHSSESGDCGEILKRLEKANNLGAGIYFTVNETDGKGRSASNIIRCRALVLDIDKDGENKIKNVYAAELEPHLIVESSPNKYHCYWLINNTPPILWSQMQKALAKRFGGDSRIHDTPRVMRLPGFYHQKKEPVLVKLLKENSFSPYSPNQLLEALGLDISPNQPDDEFSDTFDREALLTEGAQEGQRAIEMYKYACSLRARGITGIEAMALMRELNKKFKPPLSESDLKDRLKSASRHPLGEKELVQFKESKERSEVEESEESEESIGSKKVTKLPRAKYDDYIALAYQTFGDIRRDIFSDDLVFLDSRDSIWKPVINRLEALRAEARIQEDRKVMRYTLAAFQDFLQKLQFGMEPSLCVDIPDWDGVDRIAEMCSHVLLPEHGPMFPSDFEQLVKEWMGLVFRRVEDPHVQNRVLVLKGPQGIGKDTWVEALIGGLGQWAPAVQMLAEDKDTLLQLNQGVVLRIAEFDKTARVSVSMLKDLITAPYTNVRSPYDRRPIMRPCRCSFIATANVDDLLRDYTGNRRYVIFELAGIRWGYPRDKGYQMQLLAQGKVLAVEKYTADINAQERMRTYIEEKTPEDPAVYIAELWEAYAEAAVEAMSDIERIEARNRGWLYNEQSAPIFEKIARASGSTVRRVRIDLNNKGYGARSSRQRGYLLRVSDALDDDDFGLI